MPPELIPLFAKPQLLILILAFGVICGIAIEQIAARMRRRAWQHRNQGRWARSRSAQKNAIDLKPAQNRPPLVLDAASQLRYVMESQFTIQPLLNKSEARLFAELDRMVINRNGTWQVMAQVSLGEILRSDDAEAYRCINSKRVDLLLVDGACIPRCAIEYQGGAHHQGTAAARDAVKKEALRRAGIGYQEIIAGQTTPTELKRLVEKLVDCPPDAA